MPFFARLGTGPGAAGGLLLESASEDIAAKKISGQTHGIAVDVGFSCRSGLDYRGERLSDAAQMFCRGYKLTATALRGVRTLPDLVDSTAFEQIHLRVD